MPLPITLIAAHEGFGTAHFDKLVPSLQKLGCELQFVGWDRNLAVPRNFTAKGLPCRMIFRGWGYRNRLLALALPIWMVRLFLYLLRHRPRYVMAIDFDCGFPAVVAGCFAEIHVIYNIRDNFSMRGTTPFVLRPFIQALDKWVTRRSLRVIVPDENRIVESKHVGAEKYVVIYNCAKDITPPPKSLNARPFTVYAMGYLANSRGISLLLEAARRLGNIKVLLAGQFLDRGTEELIQHTPGALYYGLLGQEEALALCFEADVIFAFYDPSSEINIRAASNKWFDAMMAQRPILVNTECLRSKWIEEMDIGYLCAYGDVDTLVQVLQHIRQHPEEAAQKGYRGRKLYEAGFSWAAMEQRLAQLLNTLD